MDLIGAEQMVRTLADAGGKATAMVADLTADEAAV